MKRNLTTALMLFWSLVFSVPSYSIDDPYSYNLSDVVYHLEPLDKLEHLHLSYPNKTFEQLIKDNGMTDYSFVNFSMPNTEYTDPRLPVPAFWLGCFLSILGILMVYSLTKDSFEVKSALWGFVINLLFGCFIYTSFIH